MAFRDLLLTYVSPQRHINNARLNHQSHRYGRLAGQENNKWQRALYLSAAIAALEKVEKVQYGEIKKRSQVRDEYQPLRIRHMKTQVRLLSCSAAEYDLNGDDIYKALLEKGKLLEFRRTKSGGCEPISDKQILEAAEWHRDYRVERDSKSADVVVVKELDDNWEPAPGKKSAHSRSICEASEYKRALDALEKYARVSGCRWIEDEDGSAYPKPYVTDEEIAVEAVQTILAVRGELALTYHPEVVADVLSRAAKTNLGIDMPDGHDRDGYSFYEPYGRPHSAIVNAIAHETQKDKFRARSNIELVATRRELKRRSDIASRGDCMEQWRKLSKSRIALEEVIKERKPLQIQKAERKVLEINGMGGI